MKPRALAHVPAAAPRRRWLAAAGAGLLAQAFAPGVRALSGWADAAAAGPGALTPEQSGVFRAWF
ncbi:DUF1175 domain-containing protein, partial [Ralstonia pseudosolanacearum]